MFKFLQRLVVCVIIGHFLNTELQAGSEVYCYTNGRVLRDHRWVGESLWVRDGKVITPQKRADRKVDVNGMLVTPGYIDIQINGAFGVDFSSQPHRITEVATKLPLYGVTAFCPTVVSSSFSKYPAIITTLQPRPGSSRAGASILGIHLEGPFLNPQKKGAHQAELIPDQCPTDPETFFGKMSGVSLVTLAPEQPNALQMIDSLVQKILLFL